MKKLYRLKKVNLSSFVGYIVFSISEIKPYEELNQLEHELSNKKFEGNVIFDLLLSNGNNSNRFMEALFDGKKLKRSSFNIINVDKKIKRKSVNFYKLHLHLIENSILSSSQKFLIKKGYLL